MKSEIAPSCFIGRGYFRHNRSVQYDQVELEWTNLQQIQGYTRAPGDNKIQKIQIVEVAPGK